MIFHDNILLIHWTCITICIIYMKKNKHNLAKFKSQNYKESNKEQCEMQILYFTIKLY